MLAKQGYYSIYFFHVLTSADSSNIDITGLTDLKDILGFMKYTAVV